MIINYFRHRFPILKYLLLSIMLSLFVIDIDIPYALMSSIVLVAFVFFTLFLFRLLDDAGSVHFDRHEAERSYLSSTHFKWFLAANSATAIIYFAFLVFIKFSFGWHIFLFYLFSVLIYFILRKNRLIIEALPFLKYPILFYALGAQEYGVLVGSALIFITYDILEDKNYYFLGLGALFLLGILTLLDLSEWTSTIYIAAPVIIALLFRNNRYLKYLPILYFPIVYFIINQ